MSRSRSKGPFINSQNCQMFRNGGSYVGPTSTYISYVSESMVDTVTPGFKKKIADGALINNPCSYSKVEKTGGGGSFFQTRTIPGGNTYTTSGGSLTQFMLAHWPPSGARTASVSSITEDVAKAKALGNIDRSPYSIAEDIAEMRDTVRLLRDPLESIRHLTESLRRTSRRNPITNKVNNTVTRSAAEAWASGRFGYLPLYNSIGTIISSLGASGDPRDAKQVILTAHGSCDDRNSVVDPDIRYTWSQGYDMYYHGHSKDVKSKAYVHYRLSNPVRDWRYKYGLRLKDAPETLWAIMPYSFLIDRVSNISTALRAVAAFSDPSIEILGGGVVTKLDTYEIYRFITESSNGYTTIASGDDYVQHSFSYNRSLWTPRVLDAFVTSDFRGLVKDITSTVDIIALIKLAFS